MGAETPQNHPALATAQRLVDTAAKWVGMLSTAQRRVACFPFAGDESFQWHYTPGPRAGLRLKDMTGEQQAAALELFDAGLSMRGARQAREIITLETILHETERITGQLSGHDRDPELYYFSIFGDPLGTDAWRWRANGHHLALHFTIAGGNVISSTPLFFGANPAEVRHGPATGQRTLKEEEDLARALVATLAPEQKIIATAGVTAPGDILTRNYRRVDPAQVPDGIGYAALSGQQRARLVALLQHYTSRVANEVDANVWRRIEGAGLDTITFAWAGSETRGQAHYYAVKGPTFLIEYDNSQDDSNHIHSVWRDFKNDWGLDVLAQHYAAHHE
jgi:hypothetical protein